MTRGLAATCATLALATAAPLRAQPPETMPGDAVPVQLSCDALRWTGPIDQATNAELGPARSIEEAAAILARHKIPFSRSRGSISATMAESEFRSIATLPQGEPIIFPDREGGTICALVPHADSV